MSATKENLALKFQKGIADFFNVDMNTLHCVYIDNQNTFNNKDFCQDLDIMVRYEELRDDGLELLKG